MKILTVGHSRSGKTSFMAGLYHQYGDVSEGFGLWMADSSKRDKLIRMGKNVSKGHYPAGTDIASVYNFWLQYDNELLIPFDWYDYRGGALSETSTTSRDARRLVSQINSADALIVFLDGEKIVNITDEDLEDEYDVLLWAIQRSISNRVSEGNYFPVSFIITKGDLYQTYDPLYDSSGLAYFRPIIKTISQSNAVSGMLEVIEVSKDGILNVFAPLIFSLYYGMHHYISEKVNSINSEIDKYNKLDPCILNDIISIFKDKASDRDKAQDYIEKINREKQQLQTLESLSGVMEEILKTFREEKIIIQF